MNRHLMQERNLEAYALGALDADELEAFEAHLSGCVQCQRELASYAPVLRQLQKFPRPIPPRAPKYRSRLAPLSRAIYPIAAILLLMFGTFLGARIVPTESRDMLAIAALAATSSREINLSGLHVSGRAIVGLARRRTAFVLDGLPPPPSGHDYQVWLIGNTSYSPGTLRRNGNHEILLAPGDLLERVRLVTVTIEPIGGSRNMGQSSVARSDI
jgi:Anti-sigma-K factor rskA/Putative zinc-finger